MTDLRLPVGNTIFVVRTAMLVVKDGELLVQADTRYDFLCLPGGALQAGEWTLQGARREWQEEIGLPCGPLELLGLIENFFVHEGQPWHELGAYYRMGGLSEWPAEGSVTLDNPHVSNHWIPVSGVSAYPLMPMPAQQLLSVPAGQVRHILNREVSTQPAEDLRLRVGETGVQVRVHLLFVQGGRLLTVTVAGSDFRFLPGGTVKAGEDSASAARREWHEETGQWAKTVRLVGFVEGFDPLQKRQQLGYCYRVESDGLLPAEPFAVLDETNLTFEWLPVGELPVRPVHPVGLIQLLQVPVGSVIHLTNEW